MNRKQAEDALANKAPFESGNLKGYYPATKVYPDGGSTYVVKSYALPIAVFDGDTWHVLDSDFISVTTSRHLNFVTRVIGDNVVPELVPTKASMVALVDKLTGY